MDSSTNQHQDLENHSSSTHTLDMLHNTSGTDTDDALSDSLTPPSPRARETTKSLLPSTTTNKESTKQKLKPNLRRDQIVVAKTLKHNSFLSTDIDCLPEVPRPVPPQLSGKLTPQKLQTIQEFISSFEYNFLPEFFFNINKHRPLYQIMDTCTEIIREALPLRCVEGTFLAIFATQQFENLFRYPVSFRSCVGNTSYKHIVLIVQNGSKFGALGLSRKSSLMYKQLKYPTLSAIIKNFWKNYEKIGHTLLGFTVGLPVPNNAYSKDVVLWEFLQFSMRKHDWETQITPVLNQFAKESQKVNDEFRQACKLSTRTKRTYHGFLVSKYNKRIQAQLEKDAQMAKAAQKSDKEGGASNATRPKSAAKKRPTGDEKNNCKVGSVATKPRPEATNTTSGKKVTTLHVVKPASKMAVSSSQGNSSSVPQQTKVPQLESRESEDEQETKDLII